MVVPGQSDTEIPIAVMSTDVVASSAAGLSTVTQPKPTISSDWRSGPLPIGIAHPASMTAIASATPERINSLDKLPPKYAPQDTVKHYSVPPIRADHQDRQF